MWLVSEVRLQLFNSPSQFISAGWHAILRSREVNGLRITNVSKMVIFSVVILLPISVSIKKLLLGLCCPKVVGNLSWIVSGSNSPPLFALAFTSCYSVTSALVCIFALVNADWQQTLWTAPQARLRYRYWKGNLSTSRFLLWRRNAPTLVLRWLKPFSRLTFGFCPVV